MKGDGKQDNTSRLFLIVIGFALLVFLGALSPFGSQALADTTTRVSIDSSGNQADNNNHTSSISANGRYVAFMSYPTNLVPGDTNGYKDIFVYQTEKTPSSGGGGGGCSVSPGSTSGVQFSILMVLALLCPYFTLAIRKFIKNI